MRPLSHVTLLSSLALLLTGASVGARVQQPESQPVSKVAATATASPASASTVASRDGFAGTWVYNAEDSLNAANGRKEDNAALKRAGNAGTAGRSGGGTRGGGGSGGSGGGSAGAPGGPVSGGGSGGGSGGYGGYGGGNGPSPFTPLVANERRDLVRDLLVEVPTELTIKVSEAAVTFTDHLKRALTYPTTGKKQKYQLSASVFEAKAYWDGTQFKKDIEGADGFKMHETYFLSDSGQRLFVIVRVGDPTEKDAPVVGVNRIYDRVDHTREVISRYIVIALALGAAALQASRGMWLEASGLAALAAGLIALRLAPARPHLKRLAYLGFLVTAIVMAFVLVRRYR